MMALRKQGAEGGIPREGAAGPLLPIANEPNP